MNALHNDQFYKVFYVELRGPQINHLSFADDIIIFGSTHRGSIKLIMNTFAAYEEVSDQLVNKEKSHFMLSSKTPPGIVYLIHSVPGFSKKKDSPISYLGCSLYIGG